MSSWILSSGQDQSVQLARLYPTWLIRTGEIDNNNRECVLWFYVDQGMGRSFIN